MERVMALIDDFVAYHRVYGNRVLQQCRDYADNVKYQHQSGVWKGLFTIICTGRSSRVYDRLLADPRYDEACDFMSMLATTPDQRIEFFEEYLSPNSKGGIGVQFYSRVSSYLSNNIDMLAGIYGDAATMNEHFAQAQGFQYKMDLVTLLYGMGEANARRFWSERLDPDFTNVIPFNKTTLDLTNYDARFTGITITTPAEMDAYFTQFQLDLQRFDINLPIQEIERVGAHFIHEHNEGEDEVAQTIDTPDGIMCDILGRLSNERGHRMMVPIRPIDRVKQIRESVQHITNDEANMRRTIDRLIRIHAIPVPSRK